MKFYSIPLIIILGLTTNIFSQLPFTTYIITPGEDGSTTDGPTYVYAIDVDGDSLMDVLSASYFDDKIAWYENDGNQNFIQHIITTNADGVSWLYAIDMDGDVDIDVLSASTNDDKIAWYENDGNQSFSTHIITTSMDFAFSVYAADVDSDGDIDVLSGSRGDDKVAWYENDGNQGFTTHIITDNVDESSGVYAIDLDGDGDTDVLSTSRGDDHKVEWYENDGSQNFEIHIITTNANGARMVTAEDLDKDGDLDVLSANWETKLAWYENDGNQNFTTHFIETSRYGSGSVYPADVDNDGDLDLFSATAGEDKVAWLENDGNENFKIHVITTDADFADTVYGEDVDGDGDIDVLSASRDGDKVEWYENLGNFPYGSSIEVYPNYISPKGDTIFINGCVINPENHPVSVLGMIRGENSSFQDSIILYDDGIKCDENPNANKWSGAKWFSGLEEDMYTANLSTHDNIEGTTHLSFPSLFTTIGPFTLADEPSVDYFYEEGYRRQYIYLVLRNKGSNVAAQNVTASLSTSDLRVKKIVHNDQTFGDFAAGVTDTSDHYYTFDYVDGYGPDSTINNPIAFNVTIYSDNYPYWTDTFKYQIVTSIENDPTANFPTEFALSQNYPNPFNPTTSINYYLSSTVIVELKIYNQLGQVIRVLEKSWRLTGIHQALWDGKDEKGDSVASGLYFYRMKAGSFIQTRKMILMK